MLQLKYRFNFMNFLDRVDQELLRMGMLVHLENASKPVLRPHKHSVLDLTTVKEAHRNGWGAGFTQSNQSVES